MKAYAVYAGIEAVLGPGAIVAVYRRACLLETEAAELITLALPELGNGPNAILASAPHGFAAWPAGVRFRPYSAHGLYFEHGVRLDWSHAARWAACDTAPSAPPRYERSAFFAAALQGHAVREGLLPILLGEEPSGAAQQALARRAAPSIARLPHPQAAEQLIGVGPGSTPSGDDLVAGLLLTLHYARHPAAEELRPVAQTARTTRLSRALLAWAARGEAREHTLALLRALFHLPEPEILQALAPVLEYGATSGADQCAGILIGLNIIRETAIA